MIRALLLVLALAGCEYNEPLSMFDDGIDEICKAGEGVHSYTWKGQTVTFNLRLTDDTDQIYTWCGPDAKACTDGDTIWAPVWPNCPYSLAHELNHLFSNHAVDAPH